MSTIGFYFRLPKAETNALRDQLNSIAAAHGYIAHAGPTAGVGNAAALMVGIAAGDGKFSYRYRPAVMPALSRQP